MPDYRRIFIKGGTYFFTAVTYQRFPIFLTESSVNLLKTCLKVTMQNHPFKVEAIVVLPDHIHTIWTLPGDDHDFSTRWRIIKKRFSLVYSGDRIPIISKSLIDKREKGIWQRRFWEHVIRDDEDLYSHLDYVHYNPVKHGLVDAPGQWKQSSFHNFVKEGYYPADWGAGISEKVKNMDFE